MTKFLTVCLAWLMLGQLSYAQTVFLESFDATSTPAGWTNSALAGDQWRFSTTADYDVSTILDHTNNGGNYAWVDFSGTDDSTILTTPVIDVSTLTVPFLQFFRESHYISNPLNPFNLLHVEAWNGSAWVNVATFQGNTPFGWSPEGFDMTAFTFAGGDSLQVRFHGESGGAVDDYWNDLLIDDVRVMEMPSCPIPSGFNTANITSNSVDLNWMGMAGSWIIEYGPNGFALGSGTTINTSTRPFSVTGLMGNTSYDFYIRAVCAPGDSSVWTSPISATTLCGSFTPPYLEEFTTFLDPCWAEGRAQLSTTTVINLGTANWLADGFGNVGATGAAKINLYSVGREEWLISPSIDLGTGATPYQVEFDVALTDFANTNPGVLGVDDTLAFVISEDNGATWEQANVLQYWLPGSEPSATGDHIVISLAGYTGQVRFGFYAASTVSNEDNDIFVDNFEVRAVPSCPDPSALTASGMTQNSVMLGWTENGMAMQWEVEYGPVGFTPGSGTRMVVATNPAPVGGLMPSTSYDFYVRAICAPGDSSSFEGPRNFQTLCGPIVAPWMESFAAGSLPNCWDDRGNDPYIFNTSPDWGASGTSDRTSGGGTNYAWVDGSGTAPTLDTLVTPEIDLSNLTTPHLCFSLFSNNVNDNSNNTIHIELFDGAAWVNVATYQQNFGPDWADFSFDLASFNVTGNVRARFVINTNATGLAYYNDILIDDVSFNNGGCPETCIPVSAIAATNVMQNSADITWNGAGNNFIIEYDTSGFTPGTGMMVSASASPFTLTGLMPNSPYDVFVRAVCAPGDTSLPSPRANFTTLANCPIPSALVATNITGASADLGWTENGTATQWEIEYGAAGFTLGSGTVVVTTNNPFSLSGLMGNTGYDFYVRAICAPGDTSMWSPAANFTTSCPIYTPVYFEDFDNYLNNCWEEAEGRLGTSTVINYGTGLWGTGFFGNTGSNDAAYLNLYSTNRDEWIISPSIDLGNGSMPYQAEFNIALTDYNNTASTTLGVDDTIAFVISTDNGATWELANVLQYWLPGSEPSNTGDHITVNLSGYTGVVRFGFYGASSVSNADNDVFVDSFWVRPAMMTPPPPPPYYTVDQINDVDADGVADSLGVNVRLRGVVHCNDFRGGTGLEFYMGEYTNDGIRIFDFTDVSGYVVNESDSIEVWGTITQFNGHLQIDPDSIVVLATGNPLLMPMSVTQLSEGTENKFIEFMNGSLVDPAQWTNSGSGFNVEITNGTDTIVARIDDQSSLYGQPAPMGNFNITGWGAQFDPTVPRTEGYQMFPCGLMMIQPDVRVSEIILDSVYCNVATVGGSFVLTNVGQGAAMNVPYRVELNGNPLLFDTLTMLAPAASDTIVVLGVPVTPGTGLVVVYAAMDSLAATVSVSDIDATANITNTLDCNGDTDGAAMASSTGFFAASSFAWSNNTTGAMLNNVGAGTYTVTVTDNVGCTDTASVMFVDPPATVIVTDTVINPLCNGDSTGAIMNTVSGGTPPYSFTWDNGATTEDLMNLPAGNYTGTISDANGCFSSNTFTITEPTALVVTITDNGDGTAMGVPSGGTAPYTFLWDAAANNQTTATATGLLDNTTYSLTVTDDNGCTAATSATIIIVGIEAFADGSTFNMFPNPTSEYVMINFELVNSAEVSLNIMNAIGQRVLSKDLGTIQAGTVELNVNELSAGVYTVQFIANGQQVTRKLVVSKQ